MSTIVCIIAGLSYPAIRNMEIQDGSRWATYHGKQLSETGFKKGKPMPFIGKTLPIITKAENGKEGRLLELKDSWARKRDRQNQ